MYAHIEIKYFLTSMLVFQALACTGPLVTALKGLHGELASSAARRLIMALAKGVTPPQRTIWERSALDELRAALPEPFRGLPDARGRQEDACEFLKKLDELLQVPTRCFAIGVTEQLTCAQCRDMRERTETHMEIALSLPDAKDIPCEDQYTNPYHCTWSLRDWVKSFQQAEAVERKCSKCGGITAQKSMRVHAAPDVLRIVLKYFAVDNKGKASKPIRRWSEYESIELEVAGTQVKAKYRLFGIIFHHGSSVNAGHYTFAGRGSGCAGLQSCNGQIITETGPATCANRWFHYNDSTIEGPSTLAEAVSVASGRTSAGKSKGGFQPEIAAIGNNGHAPYILFYTRLADTGYEPPAPDCGLCTRGYEWRRALE